jgi:hypothetical protein
MRVPLFALVAVLSSFARETPPAAHSTPRGPVLLVAQGASLEDAHARIALPIDPRPLGDEERAAALVLQVLPESELSKLDAALTTLVERLEVRQNPIVEDLADGEPTDAVLGVVVADAPALAASYAFTSRRVVTGDRRTVIAVADSCDDATARARGARCVSAWPSASDASAGHDPDARRARFFAWSVSMAVKLELPDATALATARNALREASARIDGHIAFAASADDLVPRFDAKTTTIRAKARRALDLMGEEGARARLLQVLAHEPEPGRSLVLWMTLGPRELFVVPRLASVARSDEVAAEVSRTLANAGVRAEWRHRPAPL